MSKTKQKLDWMRAQKDETPCAKRRTWRSRCGLYKIVESVGKLPGMGTRYYAVNIAGGESIISRHSKRGPAERACQKHESE